MTQYSFQISDFEQGGFYVNNGADYNKATEIRSGKHNIVNPVSISVLCPGYQWSFICYDSNNSFTRISESSGYKDSGEIIDVSSYTWIRQIRIELHDTSGISPPKTCTLVYSYNWHIGGDGFPANDGFPEMPASSMAKPYPAALWRIDDNINHSMPYHLLLPDTESITLKTVYQPEYITIHGSNTGQTEFDNHGLAVLCPTSCTITENFNGKWELSIEHPIDADGKWEYIQPHNIIKALGQLYTIRQTEQQWNGSTGKVTAYAEHVFYQLNDWWVYPGAPIRGGSVKALMQSIGRFITRNIVSGQTYYTYNYDSDVAVVSEDVGRSKWYEISDGMTLTEFVLGGSGLIATFGGELYRDNFKFSIMNRMENSSDNAFEIRIGKNLRGIKRTFDISTLCTYFRGYDNYGHWFAISWTDSAVLGVTPHSIIRSKNFSYSFSDDFTEDKSAAAEELLAADCMAFFNANCAPLVSYEVDIEDAEHNPDYEEFSNKPEYKVGNIGTIFDYRAGISVRLMITKTVTDAVTGKIKTVCFGDTRSFTGSTGYRTAIADLEPIWEESAFQLHDSSGALLFDVERYSIRELAKEE